ncbi:uracil-DNA glycosylase family protein [Helicobacter sp. 23-1044]
MNTKAQKHPFAPVFESDSKVLILGSFPPKSSIEAGFYYGDSSNRFWDILGALFGDSDLKSKSKDDKITFLKSNRIALWDIWGHCYKNPQDSAYDKHILPEPESEKVDLSEILRTAKIQKIFTTIGGSENSTEPRGKNFKKWGVESWLWENYAKYFPHCNDSRQIVCPLYSTSPLSKLRVSDEKMLDDYKQIKEILEK